MKYREFVGGSLLARVPGVRANGFTLVESLVAFAIFVSALGSLVQLAVASRRATSAASARSIGGLLAADKMEQLRASPWPSISPPDSLDRDVSPFSDSPAGYVRRWWVQPLASDANTVLLQVRVVAPGGQEVRFVSLRTRQVE